MKNKIVTTVIVGIFIFQSIALAQTEMRSFKAINNLEYHTPNKKLFAYGSIIFSYATRPTEYRAEIFVASDTDRPVDFSNAEYIATKENGSVYVLEFKEVNYNDGIRHSTVLNPNDTLLIHCSSPFNPENDKILKIEIKLKDGRKLLFIPEEK